MLLSVPHKKILTESAIKMHKAPLVVDKLSIMQEISGEKNENRCIYDLLYYIVQVFRHFVYDSLKLL